MSVTLLQFVHRALEKSRVNRHLLNQAATLSAVRVNDLYERYPDFCIDVDEEQGLMEAHDRVVFQFPFYWYASPSLLKEWFDLVLQYGWAYGKGGDALRGKVAKVAVSTGGSAESYSGEDDPDRTMDKLLLPMIKTVELCGMQWAEPFFVHGALHKTEEEMAGISKDYTRWLLED